MEINDSYGCCGMKELSGLGGDNKSMLREVYDDKFNEGSVAFYVFSDTISNGCGTSLARYIKFNNLGNVTQSAIRINPNTKNKIRLWIWEVNNKALDIWARKNGFEDECNSF